MAAFSTAFFINLALTAASVAYQAKQAKKARAAAAAAADARKGTEIPVEGSSVPLPVCYGRNLIGGSQVYFRTSSNYTFANPLSGGTVFNSNLGSSRSGKKNEYLYIQQAVCQGKISKFIDWRIDDQDSNTAELQYGQRAHCYTGTVASTDPMILANFSSRTNALFTNAAHASMVFRLNRDEPQYGGPPSVSFFVEGNLVYDIQLVSGVYSLSTNKLYSNNPALCLLDYLLNSEYGRGLSINEIDLESFYKAKLVCNTIVKTNVNLSGNIWLRNNINTRNIPLYECNIILPSDRSVRENVISILSTMGDAVLVWSNGKYKLKLQYPQTESQIELSSTLSDNEIIRGSFNIKYPSASERINYCTIRYADEAEDFKEKTASWPKKGTTIYNSFLAQDNNVPLEKSFSEEGITDFYHALAKAEELVRLSRTDVRYSFTVSIENYFLEPGDIVKIDSKLNFISNEYIKIQEVKVNEDGTADITGTRYDYTQLAWNVADDQVIESKVTYDFSVEPPTNFSASTVSNNDSIVNSVLLSWTESNDNTVVDYVIEAGTQISGSIVYSTIAVLPARITSYVHNPNLLTAYFYRIRARNRLGQYSQFTTDTQATVTQQALLGSINLLISAPLLSFVKSISGPTVPTSQSSTIEFQFNTVKQQYSSSTTVLPSKQWTITSSLSGNLNQNGFYSTSISDNIALVTVSPSQGNTFNLQDTAITYTIKYNPTGSELGINSAELLTFSRSIFLNEIKDGIQGVDGSDGATNALIPIYIRATSLPATPTGGSISFGPFSVVTPTGWSVSIPDGTNPVYVSYGLGSIIGVSGTDSSITWSVPALAFANGQQGDPGVSGSSFYEATIYRRSSTVLSTPTGGTFNFNTRELTPPTDWYAVIPPYIDNTQLYATKYLFVTNNLTSTVTAGSWDTPNILTVDGQDGASGLSVYTFNIYLLSATQPTTPSGGSYNFTSNTVTLPSGGWSLTVPSNTASGGQVWVSSTTASITGASGTDDTLTWTSPSLLVRNGIDGTNGSNGQRGPGWFRAVSDSGTQQDLDNLTTAQINGLFINFTGFVPVTNDRFIISVPSTGAVKAWVYSGSEWISQAQFIDGNLLVSGTVSGNALNIANGLFTVSSTGQITAVNSITVQDPITGKSVIINSSGILIQSASSGGRMILTQDFIKVIDENNILRVQIGNLSL